jgi:hypothetical protein
VDDVPSRSGAKSGHANDDAWPIAAIPPFKRLLGRRVKSLLVKPKGRLFCPGFELPTSSYFCRRLHRRIGKFAATLRFTGCSVSSLSQLATAA